MLAPTQATGQSDEEELPVERNAFPTDRYKPLKLLGSGKFGSVYLARDRLLDKVVAVKTLHALSAKELVSFQKEAKTLSKLKHESIVRILDFGTVNAEVPYMVLDYVKGETLRTVIDRGGPMPWETATKVFGQICEAFEYAHRNGILHRDLNPQNVLLVDRSKSPEATRRDCLFEVRIIDFGIAYLVNVKNDPDKTEKPEESLVGTPLYMSPDPGNGRPYEIRSEVYSLGCMLFESLSGRPPFIGNTAIETLTMHALEQPPNLSETTEFYIPPAVQSIVEKALAKNPDSRFSTMGALKEALEKAGVQEDSGGENDENDASNASPVDLERTGARDWTASYPVSLLIGITILAIAGFCLLAYSFAVQEQPLSQRMAGRAETSGSTTKKKGTEHASGPDVSEPGLNASGAESLWRRNSEHLDWLIGIDASDADLEFKNLAPGPPIVRLDVQSDSLTLKGVKSIAALPRLQHLLFRNSTLPENTFSVLATAKSLYILDLSYSSPIAADDLKELAKAPSLVTLKLAHTEIGDKHASALEKARLTGLMVNHTNLTDASLASFAKIKTLKRLTIRPAKGISQEGLKGFAKLRPDCTILSDND